MKIKMFNEQLKLQVSEDILFVLIDDLNYERFDTKKKFNNWLSVVNRTYRHRLTQDDYIYLIDYAYSLTYFDDEEE